MVIINLPFPNAKLNPNRKNGLHWGATSGLKASQYSEAYMLTCVALEKMKPNGWTPLVGQIPISITFHETDKRMRDLDNCLSSAKSAIDGIALALIVNDKNFSPITIHRGAVIKGGLMVVTVG